MYSLDFQVADQFEDTCAVDYRLHENLASVLTNDVGLRMLNDLRHHAVSLCVDPIAHNAIVGLLDAVVDVSMDTNVAQTLGNMFFWARKMIKDPYFRAAWDETMRGLNMLFERHGFVSELSDTVYSNLTKLLNNPNFDMAFESVIRQFAMFLDVRKKMMYGAGALIVNPLTGKQNSNVQRQSSNVQRQSSSRR